MYKGEPINGDFAGKDFISIQQVSRSDLEIVYSAADVLRVIREEKLPISLLNNQYQLANVYYEPSTRTSSSHAAAWRRLGGGVDTINNVSFSSVVKGESLKHTVQTLEAFSEMVVLRHGQVGAAALAALALDKPVMNAGDGVGEHPTQALLDGYTLERELGGIDDKVITIAGDLLHGRTTHSLMQLMALYKPRRVNLVAPPEYQMPQQYIDLVTSKGIEVVLHVGLEAVLPETDALYMVRLQRERLESDTHLPVEKQVVKKVNKIINHGSALQKEALGTDFDAALERLFGTIKHSSSESERDMARFLLYAINGTLPEVKVLKNGNGFNDNIYVLTPELMATMKDEAKVLHPMPIAGEIEDEVDADPRAVYLEQVENGMYVRGALMSEIMDVNVHEAKLQYDMDQERVAAIRRYADYLKESDHVPPEMNWQLQLAELAISKAT